MSDPRVSGFLSLADELLRDVARGVYECTHYIADEICLDEGGKMHE